MSLIAQSIANLLNGVSQRPQELRHSSQAQEQKNGLSHIVRGLMKRPPFVYVGKLTATITGWADAFVHSIIRDESERYHVVVANGTVKVFDAITQSPVTVVDRSNSDGYLSDPTGVGFRAATAGDTTIIVNRGVVVKQSTKKTAAQKYEALVYVRQADYGTTYQVTLNNTSVGIKTIAGTMAQARPDISTDKITSDLLAALKAEPLFSSFTFTQYGSTIHITRSDSKDFTLSVLDGLADVGLKAVKGSVQMFQDLPRKAPNGFIVEVSGDPTSSNDNYWVTYDDAGKPAQDGVWKECPAPGTLVALDPATMPHKLVRKGDVGFKDVPNIGITTLGATIYNDTSGSLVTVPWDVTIPGDIAIPANTTPTTRDHGSGAKVTIAGGGKNLLWFTYTIDTSVVETGNDVTLSVYKNGVLVSNGTTVHRAGQAQTSGMKSLSLSVVNTDVVEAKITYAKGVTPDQFRRAYFSPGSFQAITTNFRRIVAFGEPAYPAGSTITVTVDSVPFVYNVGASDVSGVTVATALQPTIDAHASFVASLTPGNSGIKIENTGNTYPVITVSVALDPTKTFSNAGFGLNMVTNEHVGRIIKNTTDGSQGTITSNTATTVTCSAGLSGGSDNKFQVGDFCTIVGTGLYFTFEPCTWNERQVGDLKVVPFPSFVDHAITDITFYQNRMGFTSGENIVFSSAGDLFNFFRYSAAQLLADDVIDVRSSHKEVSLFHSLIQWNGGLYGVSNNALWEITGDPVLTPTTIRIDLASLALNTPGPKPVAAGNRLYVTREKGGYTQLLEFFVSGTTGTTVEFNDVTQEAPKYVKGSPVAVVGDDTLGLIAIVTDDAGSKTLYIYKYAFGDDGSRRQSSWSRWDIASGQIVGLSLADGALGALTVQSDGAYFHTADLNVLVGTSATDEGAQYLDRRVSNSTAGVSSSYNAGTDTTTWTLPFNVATDGSEGTFAVVKRGPPVVKLTATRPAVNQVAVTGQGNLTGASVYIGVYYKFSHLLSRIYLRKEEVPETRGRLTLRFIDVHYRDTTSFQVIVTLSGRAARTYTVSLTSPGEGTLHVPIQGKNEYATIELVNDNDPGVCAFSSLDWEGEFTMRDQRV